MVKNLDSTEIVDELRLVLRTAMKRGYDIMDRPIKITFVQGGEPLSNRHFPEALSQIKDELPLQAKISTIFPEHSTSHTVFDKLVAVAGDYPNIIQFQVSLNSTDADYRQSLVEIPLAPFNKIREAGERWRDTVPNPRKVNLSFTISDDTPMDPDSIVETLPPELFAIRLRAWTPTNVGQTNKLTGQKVIERVPELQERFEQAGYTFIPGNPGNVEWKFKLAPGDLANFYMAMKRRLTL